MRKTPSYTDNNYSKSKQTSYSIIRAKKTTQNAINKNSKKQIINNIKKYSKHVEKPDKSLETKGHLSPRLTSQPTQNLGFGQDNKKLGRNIKSPRNSQGKANKLSMSPSGLRKIKNLTYNQKYHMKQVKSKKKLSRGKNRVKQSSQYLDSPKNTMNKLKSIQNSPKRRRNSNEKYVSDNYTSNDRISFRNTSYLNSTKRTAKITQRKDTKRKNKNRSKFTQNSLKQARSAQNSLRGMINRSYLPNQIGRAHV